MFIYETRLVYSKLCYITLFNLVSKEEEDSWVVVTADNSLELLLVVDSPLELVVVDNPLELLLVVDNPLELLVVDNPLELLVVDNPLELLVVDRLVVDLAGYKVAVLRLGNRKSVVHMLHICDQHT